jgi:hypothetical protein
VAAPVCHPLGCHRPRIPDRIVFDKLIQVLVLGCGYRRLADATYSATTLRRRRDEWIRAGSAERPRLAVLAAYDRLFGLDVEQLADGIPLGALPAAANRHRRRAALGDPGHLGSGQHRDREATRRARGAPGRALTEPAGVEGSQATWPVLNCAGNLLVEGLGHQVDVARQ